MAVGRLFALRRTAIDFRLPDACFCGSSLPYTLLEDSYCTSNCAAAPEEKCGSSATLSVYNATLLAATEPKGSSNTTSVASDSQNPTPTSSNGTGTRTSATSTSSGGIIQTATSVVSSLLSGILNPGSSSTSGNQSNTASGSVAASATSSAPSSTRTWAYRGCIADGSARAINQTALTSWDMTIGQCGSVALSGGFKYFGLENGVQCFVSNTIAYNTTVNTCTQKCGGDATGATLCGGPWSLTVYEVVTLAPGQTLSTSAVPSSSSSTVPINSGATLTASGSTSVTPSASGNGTCVAVTVTQFVTVTASGTDSARGEESYSFAKTIRATHLTIDIRTATGTSTTKVTRRRRAVGPLERNLRGRLEGLHWIGH